MTKASDIPVHCSHSELADVVSLIPNPRNPNKHPDRQIAMLAKIIRHQGWRSPIVVSNRSGFVVKGHGRLEAAKLLQVESVPVDRQDYATEADEWADLIADNRISELAETDDAALKTLLDELEDGGADLELSGFDDLEEISSEIQADGKTPEEKLDGFETAAVRQIVLLYPAEQFTEIVKMLNDLMAYSGMETHNDVIDAAIKKAHENIGNKQEGD